MSKAAACLSRYLRFCAVFVIALAAGCASTRAPEGANRLEDELSKEVEQFVQADHVSPPAPCQILFVGSSSIVKWKTLADDMAPLPVINRGFGGSHIEYVNRWFDEIVAPYRPRAIVFYAGENDLDAGKTVDGVVADFDAFMARKTAALGQVPVYFISLKPSKLRFNQLALQSRVNEAIRVRSGQRADLHYIDVASAMLEDGKPKDLYREDNLHMTAQGYAIWTAMVKPALLTDDARAAQNCRVQSPRALGDLPETGLQGQVPLVDQQSGRSLEGYRKGIRIVGRNTIGDRGGNLQLATYGHCAYVGTASIPPAAHPLEGIAVLDVRKPEEPRLVRIVASPAGYSSWEGLEASEKSGILVSFVTSRTSPIAAQVTSVPESWKPGVNASYADAFEVYDVSSDCENPRRVATVSTRSVLTGGLHGLRLSPDGKTAYLSSMLAGLSEDDPAQTSLVAYDLANPANPTLLASWKWSDDPHQTIDFGFHDGTVSNDGKTLFWGTLPMYSRRKPNDITNVMIQAFDVSSIQSRSKAPAFKLLGALHWQDCAGEMAMAHGGQYAVIHGTPYLIAGGECEGIQLHVIDVRDPANMRLVSTYTTQANDPRNAQIVAADNAMYWAHYFGIDDASDATSLFVTWFGSGLRALDIRDPAHLREFAYLNPPAHPNNVFCLMMCETTYEVSTSDVKYDRTTGNIWFVGANGGFYIAHLTPSAGANGLVDGVQ